LQGYCHFEGTKRPRIFHASISLEVLRFRLKNHIPTQPRNGRLIVCSTRTGCRGNIGRPHEGIAQSPCSAQKGKVTLWCHKKQIRGIKKPPTSCYLSAVIMQELTGYLLPSSLALKGTYGLSELILSKIYITEIQRNEVGPGDLHIPVKIWR